MAGTQEVEVHLRFDGRWIGGFEIADVRDDGAVRRVWLRRRSDGTVLPEPFPSEEVRFLDATASPASPRRAG